MWKSADSFFVVFETSDWNLLDIVRPGLEAAAVGELAEFLGEAFEVLLGLLQLFVLFIIGGGREGQAVFDPDHWGEHHHRHLSSGYIQVLHRFLQTEETEENKWHMT